MTSALSILNIILVSPFLALKAISPSQRNPFKFGNWILPRHLQVYKYILVMEDMFFTLDGSVSLQKSNSLNSRQITIEKNSSSLNDSFELHSDQKTYFTGQVIKSTCEIWLIMQHFHCAYHPQASGLIERSNSTIFLFFYFTILYWFCHTLT